MLSIMSRAAWADMKQNVTILSFPLNRHKQNPEVKKESPSTTMSSGKSVLFSTCPHWHSFFITRIIPVCFWCNYSFFFFFDSSASQKRVKARESSKNLTIKATAEWLHSKKCSGSTFAVSIWPKMLKNRLETSWAGVGHLSFFHVGIQEFKIIDYLKKISERIW